MFQSSSPSDRLGKRIAASTELNCRYDVFISFRGSDTRNTFVDHLYGQLIRKGIVVFKDDKLLEKGKSISPQLLQGIQDSRVSIVVFSKDYPSSTWCLDELAAIAECHEKSKQTAFPVFYDVDPSEVRKQKGAYENAFALHAEAEQSQQGSTRVDRWKGAMTSLAGLAGWDVRNKPEYEEIGKIVEGVIKVLGHKFSLGANDLIGIQPRVQELESLLKLGSINDEFRVLGIWGMGGIGKTTLACGLYDRVSYLFEACCFIEDVSNVYKDGAIAIQKQILRQTLDETNLETYGPSEISGIVRKRLHNVKLLIVLDNVDQFEQLEKLCIDPKLLCAGSRMIITTRDEHILRTYGADKVYEVQQLDADDACKLLCRKAFQRDGPWNIFEKLIPEVLNYAQGLPLAIRVMGSFLYTRDPSQWRATLDGLHNNPDRGIVEVLQKSYDGLQPRVQEIFLHVACFFKREREDYVKRILDACGLYPDIGIPLLIEKSFISIRNQEIHMHDMLQELGKQIARGKHLDEPECWSRLWLYSDFHRVMMSETGATGVKAIVLDQKEDAFKFNKLRAEDLSKMTCLKLLIISHKNFSGRPVSLSNLLRYFSWNGYPFTSLPPTFHPCDLVELNMPDSSLEQLWEGIVVHPSIGLLDKLVFLSLLNCCSLVSFEFGSNGSKLGSLRVLHLSGCIKLEKSPNLTGAESLEYLDMDRCTRLSTVHESIGYRKKLRFLSLRDCTNLVGLPDSIDFMSSLMTLDLCGCSEFMNLPLQSTINSSAMESLVSLDLSFCSILEVPNAIGRLWCLERLNLQGNNFVELPSTISRLRRLAYLNLSHCIKLGDLPLLPSECAPLGGRYYETTSESRDHRSGLYIFNCPIVGKKLNNELLHGTPSNQEEPSVWWLTLLRWISRLYTEPRNFRCGFDIVSPWHWEDGDYQRKSIIPRCFDHRVEGGSIIRTKLSDIDVGWDGCLFCVAFQVNNHSTIFASSHRSNSSRLPHPFYLSFESEHTEERFDMPLDLDLDKSDGSKYLWIIYISRQHCHFVATGAQITFKVRHGLIVEEWGLRMLTKEHMEASGMIQSTDLSSLIIDYVEESNRSFVPKIQLPYNWLISGEEEVKIHNTKGKEIELSNLGL
ncbi:disease resistance protein RUN1-like isoform X2 [Lotus japonicus]|uniref:disease resistance protein RUN1-like isoform X2 n=1 Tax=Lotus japonicus TaxID=34305 RepID=UPI002582B96E|nr:disease resistance protein RUN1-like isoform X2 [Lotus japonicus]